MSPWRFCKRFLLRVAEAKPSVVFQHFEQMIDVRNPATIDAADAAVPVPLLRVSFDMQCSVTYGQHTQI